MTSVDWHSPLERAGWLDPAVAWLNGRPWLKLRSIVAFDDGGYVSHAAVADFYLVFLLKILFSADPFGKCFLMRPRNLAPTLVNTYDRCDRAG